MSKRWIAAIAVVVCLIAVVPLVQAESDMDFTLVNATGYQINEVYIAPSSSEEWGEDILDDVLENGNYADVTFHPAANRVKTWDLMVVWDDGSPDTFWRGLKLAEINQITLKYNRKTDEATAVLE